MSTFPKNWVRFFRLISGFPKGGKAAGIPAGGEGRIWSAVGTWGVDSLHALARGSPGGRPWSHGQRAGSCPPRPELSCLKIFERLGPVFSSGWTFHDCHCFVRSHLSVPWVIKLPLSVLGLSAKSCGSHMVSTRTMKLEDTVIRNVFYWKQVV